MDKLFIGTRSLRNFALWINKVKYGGCFEFEQESRSFYSFEKAFVFCSVEWLYIISVNRARRCEVIFLGVNMYRK